MKIFKYEVDHEKIPIPYKSRILKAGLDIHGKLCIWILVDETSEYNALLTVVVVGTGHPVPDGYTYVDTYNEGPFVWHIFVLETAL